jgi:hypothetical protein
VKIKVKKEEKTEKERANSEHITHYLHNTSRFGFRFVIKREMQ